MPPGRSRMEWEREEMKDATTDNVIQIADFRFRRDRRRRCPRDTSLCKHKNTVLVSDGQYVRCDDCGAQLSAFWVLERTLEVYSQCVDNLNARIREFNKLQKNGLSLLAAKKVEEAWRSRTMVPSCPHCHRGILPTDNFGGSTINKRVELDQRRFEKNEPNVASKK